MDKGTQVIEHLGKQILLVDVSNRSAGEVEKIVRSVPNYVSTQPLGSVLVLTDFSGASFNEDCLRTMKETAVFDKPFIKKSALVGAESLPPKFYESMKSFSRRELPTFKNRDEALNWLAED